MAQLPEVPVKKWYQSKIVGISGVMILVFGSNFFLHFLTQSVGVTADQIQGVESTVPQVNDVVDRVRGGESILSLAGTIVGILIAYFRIWGTKTLIALPTAATPGTATNPIN